ncbi:MAG: hypothetical protein V4548_09620 [Bacteroidota bacterium]
MKKIKSIIALIAITAITFSCDNDGGDSKIALGVGAVPNITKVTTTDSFINLVDVNNGDPIDLGFTVDVAQGDVASMDIIGFYKKGTATYRAVLETNVTTFPATFNIDQTDIIDAFAEINSASDFEIGDVLTVTAELTLKNGSVVKILKDDGTRSYGQDIANSNVYKVIQTYTVACPSDLGGTFNFSTTNVTAPTGEAAAGPLTGTVTFTDNGGGNYSISDASFGGWIGLYGPGQIATGVKLSDICNKIAYAGTDQYGEVFTFTNLVVSGTQMSFHWANDYGEKGDTTLTRTDGTNWPALTL